MPSRPCSEPGCGELVPRGFCSKHAGWDNSRRHAKQRAHGRDRRSWRRLRKLVLDRDGHRCRACGSRDDLTVHFIPGGPHSLDLADYLTVCRSCHGRLDQPRSRPG